MAAAANIAVLWCNKFDENSSASQLMVQTTSNLIEKDSGMELINDNDQSREACPMKIAKPTGQSPVLSAVTILGEHNYCTKPLGSNKPMTKPTGQSPVLSAVTILGEHNYCTNPLGSNKPSKKLARKEIPREIKYLKHEIVRLRKRGLNFKAKLENAQKMSQNRAFQKITKNMTNPAKIFTMMQFRESVKNPKGRRFTTEEKTLSLSFFKRSAKCYSLLTKQFVLPSKKSLKLLLSSVKLRPRINKIFNTEEEEEELIKLFLIKLNIQ
ncbi:unnamed protein product [Euphydryas editha]|uniref:Uncharacterized protein n=1 Tax=Euphydryas editha TaxID=104508 RepID=A0AAU9UBJ5_EUPED|nr:unnamed protein product [Euphydryas editha]